MNTQLKFLISLSLITISAAGQSLFCGTYIRESKVGNNEFFEALLAMGYSTENADIMTKSGLTMTIKENPDKSYTINTVCPGRNHTLIVTAGKEFEDQLMDGRINKGIVTIEGSTVLGVNKLGNIDVMSKSEFSVEGIKTTVQVKGKSITCNWKRISPPQQLNDDYI